MQMEQDEMERMMAAENAGMQQEDVKSEDEDFDDDFFDDESEKIMRSLKEQRLNQMKDEYAERQTNKTLGHGTYTEITEEEFLPLVTKTKYVVVAFFHQDFQSCKIIDMHINKIVRDHEECRFVRLDAEKAPFFITKLQIQMLPTIIMFIDGIAADRITGLDDLGGVEDFPTINLVRRLVNGGVLIGKNRKERGEMKINKGRNRRNDSSDSAEDNEY
jgi:hypothetical protein